MALNPESAFGQREVLQLLPPGSRVPEARRFACDIASSWGASGESLENVALLTSEVVSNAFLHAEGPVTLAISRQDTQALIEVHDDSREVPRVRPVNSGRPGGLGLRILDAIAVRWGVDVSSGYGKTVWFELPVAAPVREAPAH